MSIQRFQRAKAIFLDACDRAPGERSAFVIQACGGDSTLRDQVEQMLQHDERPLTILESGQVRSHLERIAADEMDRPQETFAIPESIGGYRILRRIGEGGMGVVYLAQQENPRRTVALKVIAPGRASASMLRRFEHEAQLLGRLQHSGIAQIIQAGSFDAGHGRQPYFVMEFVAGRPILAHAAERALSVRQRLELFILICKAVEHAHQKGIIHRDLKPANILVDDSAGLGQPKILDFGVARATDASEALTTMRSGVDQLVGTIAYMSPEQMSGHAQEIDTRTDVYALGVILFELLAGRLPLDLAGKGIPETIRIVSQEEPRSLAVLNRSCRGDLDVIAAKALERDKTRRYQSAGDLAADIQRHLDDEPIEARRDSALYVMRKTVRRYRLQFGALAALFIVITAAAVIATALLGRAKAAERQAIENYRESLIAQARATRHSGILGQRTQALEAIAKAAAISPTLEARNEAVAAMTVPDMRFLSAPDLSGLLFTCDAALTRCAVQALDGSVNVHRLPDGLLIAAIPPPRATMETSFAVLRAYLDGRVYIRIYDALNQPRRLEVWRLPEGRLLFELTDIPDRSRFDVSPDGRTLAVPRQDSAIHFHDLETGQEMRRIQVEHDAGYLAFDPTGKHLVRYHGRDILPVMIDLETEAATPIFGGRRTEWAMAWSPDGSLIAASDGHVIGLWDTANQRSLGELAGHGDVVTILSFSPRGNMLLSSSWDGSSIIWDVATRRPLLRIPGVSFLHWTCDGTLAGQRGGRLALARFEAGDQYRLLVGRLDGVQQLIRCFGVFDPAGGVLYACNPGVNGLRAFDIETGIEAACVPAGAIDQLSIDAAGEALLTWGRQGLFRWPIERGENRLRIGPPSGIDIGLDVASTGSVRLSLSADGDLAAFSPQGIGPEVLVIDPRSGSVLRSIQTLRRASAHTISPDGRWLATGTWLSDGGQVWDLHSGVLAAELPLEGSSNLAFSADSSMLATVDNNGLAIWNTQSWSRMRAAPIGSFWQQAFDPTGRMLALLSGPNGQVKLVDVATLSELATLTPPEGLPASSLTFSADGSRLGVFTRQAHVICLWDLAAIRASLAKIGLDWSLPPYPARSVWTQQMDVVIDLSSQD